MRSLLSLAALLTVSLFASARADEDKVPLDQLPKAVSQAVKKRFPKAELVDASKETEGGKTEYEVTIKNAGKKTDVTLTPDGTIVGMEKEIDVAELPQVVIDTVESKYKNAKYKKIEEIIKVKDGKESFESYEILLVTADKKTVELVVAVTAMITKTEEKK